MAAVDVHGAGPTDSLSAGSAETQRGIYFVLYFNQCVQEHGTAFLHVDVVGHILRSVSGVIRVCSVDIEPLHCGFLLLSETLIELQCVVNLEQVGCVGQMGRRLAPLLDGCASAERAGLLGQLEGRSVEEAAPAAVGDHTFIKRLHFFFYY